MNYLAWLGGFHGMIFVCLALAIVYIDHKVFGYILGKHKILSKKFIKYSHLAIWIGLILMISSGLILAQDRLWYLVGQPVFQFKLVCIFTLLINALFIGHISRVTTEIAFADLNKKTKIALFISGTISLSAWISAAVVGHFYL